MPGVAAVARVARACVDGRVTVGLRGARVAAVLRGRVVARPAIGRDRAG